MVKNVCGVKQVCVLGDRESFLLFPRNAKYCPRLKKRNLTLRVTSEARTLAASVYLK